MSRGGAHYIPRSEGDFDAWVQNYYIALKEWWEAQGMDPADLDPLAEALNAWRAAYPAHIAARAAAHAAAAAKDAARATLEQVVRPLTAFVQSFPTTTNADRATMGIAVRPPRAGAVPAPTSAPRVIVTGGERLTHELRLVDESTPTRRARPRGAERAEVFVALTAPAAPAPTDPDLYRYLGSVSDGATTLTFASEKGGMQAHYLARWMTRRGAAGPWSEVASATVAA